MRSHKVHAFKFAISFLANGFIAQHINEKHYISLANYMKSTSIYPFTKTILEGMEFKYRFSNMKKCPPLRQIGLICRVFNLKLRTI